MKIRKALEEALKTNGIIARKSILKGNKTRKTVIQPNLCDDCIAMEIDEKEGCIEVSYKWNPTAEDLLATDWEVYKIKGEKFYIRANYIKLGLESSSPGK